MKITGRLKKHRKPNFPKKRKYKPYKQKTIKNKKTMLRFILTKLSQLWDFIKCPLTWIYIAIFAMGLLTGYFAVKR